MFEIARPLQTGDPQDAQFTLGGTAQVGIAYWDGNKGRRDSGGWSDAGHIVSVLDGWIDVTFAATAAAPTAASTDNAGLLGGPATAPWAALSLGALTLAIVLGGRLTTRRVRR